MALAFKNLLKALPPSTAAFDANFAAGVFDPRITFTRATDATYVNSAGNVATATTNVPRITYDPSSLACLGYLNEPQRTNLALYSQQLDNAAWTKRGTCAVVANDTTAPDGTLTADKLTFAGFSTGDIYQIGPTATVAAALSPSFYIKKQTATGTFTVQSVANPANGQWTIDLALIGSGWERITSTHPAVTVVTPFTGAGGGNDSINIFQAAGSTVVVWLWGVQIEQASTASSYIPTTGASATRAADVAYVDVATWLPALSVTNSTFYSELQLLDPASATRVFGSQTGGGSPIEIGGSAGDAIGSWDGVTYIAVTNAAANMLTAPRKVAVSLASGARTLALSGSTSAPGANAMPAITRVYIGSEQSGSLTAAALFRVARVYYGAQSAGQLATLTT